MANYEFYQNRDCEFFPCHPWGDKENFNCLFCYCPLYALGDACGGSYVYLENGVKDCSKCLLPHRRENYRRILEKMPQVLELARKKTGGSDAETPK